MLMADSERLLGARHPNTLAARDSLAAAFLANGQPKDAIEHYKRLLADTEAASGRDHPDAIAARASLASAYRRSGKPKDAIALYQRVLADRERTAGADHPDAIAARANLAFAYRSAGQLRRGDPPTTSARWPTGSGCRAPITRTPGPRGPTWPRPTSRPGRLGDAVHHYEQALADSERMLGPGDAGDADHPVSLAAALYADGRLTEAVAVLQRALADSRALPRPGSPDDPDRARQPRGGHAIS